MVLNRMQTSSRRALWLFSFAIVTMVIAGPPAGRLHALASAAQDAPSTDRLIAEAVAFFQALDYEQAVPALDKAIAALEPRSSASAAERTALINALAMRARARFGLGDVQGASADFRSLLLLDPGFAFDQTISPRVVALLETVRKTSVGALRLSVDPSDAAIEIAARPVRVSADPIPVVAGEVAVTVTRIGFRSFEQTVTVSPGVVSDLAISLERTAAAVYLVTSPPDVEVFVDGVSRGRTAPGSLPAEYALVPGEIGVSPQEVSVPLILSDIAVGTHAVAFKADCRVSEERPLVIERLADYRVEPVRLRPAVAPVSIQSTPPGAKIYLDGKEAGETPATLPEVCEGSHRLDVRGSHGRFSKTVTVTVGEPLTLSGVLTPAFALLPSGEPLAPGLPDPRNRIERVLANATQLAFYVPSEAELEGAMGGQPIPQEWLAFDANQRPIGAAAAVTAAARRDLSERLSNGLGVQGIAAITQPSLSSSELVVAMLASGSARPDVIAILPEDVASTQQAIEQLGYEVPMFRHHLGAVLLETHGSSGAQLVLASVDPQGAAARAGLAPGDRIAKAAGNDVHSADQFEQALADHVPSAALSLTVTGRAGSSRQLDVDVMTTPRVLSAMDRTLLFNVLAVRLRGQLAAAEPSDAAVVRLNLAVALLRIGDYQGALDELRKVDLPPGVGISKGTQQYLLGLAYEGLGDMSSAREAWQAAVAAGGTLTEDGPLVSELVSAKTESPDR